MNILMIPDLIINIYISMLYIHVTISVKLIGCFLICNVDFGGIGKIYFVNKVVDFISF